jgi:dUTP pyrophosphatase
MSPIKANLGDVGYDLHVDSFTDDKDFFTVKTGISLSMPIGWFSEVYARSSLHKKGLMLYNSVGIIDQSYQGEIILKLFKTRPDAVLTTGDKVAQIIPKKYAMVELEEVQEFDLQTERGSQGFGSTGK